MGKGKKYIQPIRCILVSITYLYLNSTHPSSHKMKHMLVVMLLLLPVFSCQREEVEHKGPVGVEYRVSSASGATVGDISYTNETGGTTDLDDAPLPFSVKFKFSQRPGSLVLLALLSDQGGQQQSVKGVILIDGQEVKNETGVGASPAVSIAYIVQ